MKHPCHEIRQINTRAMVAGVPQLIAKIQAGSMYVDEISIQPDANCHIQLFEGNSSANPLSPVRFVPQNALWSIAGKIVYDDIYAVTLEPINITTMVRIGGSVNLSETIT